MDLIGAAPQQSVVVEAEDISKSTLDAIGQGLFAHLLLSCSYPDVTFEATFDCDVGALDNEDNELAKSFKNLV
jgi:hypothetical protein